MLYQKEFISKMSDYFISEALMPKCLDFEKKKKKHKAISVSCLVVLTVTNVMCVWECSVFFRISRDADITPCASVSLGTKAGTAMPFPATRWMTWSLRALCSPRCCTERLIRVGFVKGRDVTSPVLSLTQNSLLNPKPLLLGAVLSSTHSLVSCI